MITVQMLKIKSGEFDIESIHTLVLNEEGINDLGCIAKCTGLENLNLSHNQIKNLHALGGLNQLTKVNLSGNRVQDLDGLQTLEKLTHLNLAGNLIESVGSLRYLSTLEQLTDLRLRDPIHGLTNPVCSSETYKKDTTSLLSQLVILDGERLKGKGSEVFKLFEEIDKSLTDTKTADRVPPLPKPGPWIDTDCCELRRAFENSNMSDAEKQLRELLAECKRVGHQAEQKVRKEWPDDNSAKDVA